MGCTPSTPSTQGNTQCSNLHGFNVNNHRCSNLEQNNSGNKFCSNMKNCVDCEYSSNCQFAVLKSLTPEVDR